MIAKKRVRLRPCGHRQPRPWLEQLRKPFKKVQEVVIAMRSVKAAIKGWRTVERFWPVGS
jgi:hypothetical protein